MEININDIENRILQSKSHFQNITIRGKKFKKDTRTRGRIHIEDIYSLTILYEKDGQNYEKSFVMAVPYNNPRYEELRQLNAYAKQRKLYSDLFPQFELLLPSDPLHPEFYGTDGQDVLILEDLSLSGWRQTVNRQLSLQEITVAFRQLAKFHAVGVAVHESQPQLLTDVLGVRGPSIFDSFSSTARKESPLVTHFRDVVRRTDAGFAEQHPEVLLYFENYLQQMSENSLQSDDKFEVLCHGSPCTRHIWFAYDDLDRVTGAKFTNFEHCHWGNPISDLIFFTVTSMLFEVFEESFDFLLDVYATTLNATLEQLNCEQRMSVEELRASVDSNYEYFLYFLVAIAAKKASNAESDEVTSVEYIDEKSYSRLSKQWMSHFIRKGIFSQYEDLAIAIHTFVRTFEAENQASIFGYYTDHKFLKPGSNFTSLIVRLSFEYHQGEESSYSSVLVKIPSLCVNYDDMKDMNVYNHEIFVYQKLLPELNRLWTGEPFAPACYAVSATKIMVLEDLAVRGYRVCDKKRQLDLDHCRTALANLARYHAVALKYLRQCDQATYNLLKDPIQISANLQTQYRALFSKFLKVFKPLVADSVHQRMVGMRDKLPRDASFGANVDESGLNVIGHCDYWTNNILFRYDEDGHPRSLKMVDWQLARLASPAVDLIFFFVTSVRFEVYETYKDALLNFYVDTLGETLSQLDLDLVFTRVHLDEAIRRYRYYFWHYVATELPFMMTDQTSIENETNSDVSDVYLAAALKWVNHLAKEDLM